MFICLFVFVYCLPLAWLYVGVLVSVEMHYQAMGGLSVLSGAETLSSISHHLLPLRVSFPENIEHGRLPVFRGMIGRRTFRIPSEYCKCKGFQTLFS